MDSASERIKLGQDRSKGPVGDGSDDHWLWSRSRLSITGDGRGGRGVRHMGRVLGLLTGDGADRNRPAGATIVNRPGAEEKPDLSHHRSLRPWKNETATVLPAWESMNDQQLDRNLRSVGREVFVAYFTEFCDRSRSNEDVAAQIEEERGYTDKSCRSRTSHARSIIGAGRTTDALGMVSCSTSPRVPGNIKKKASALLRDRESGLS